MNWKRRLVALVGLLLVIIVNMTSIFYIKQFNIYYAGTRDGALVFSNERRNAVALASKEAAEDRVKIMGDGCEIEERIME